MERVPHWTGSAAARAELRGMIAKRLDAATGDVRCLDDAGEVRAAVLWALDEDSWYGTPTIVMNAFGDPDRASRAWLREQVEALVPTLDERLDARIFLPDFDLLPTLEALGVRPSVLELSGEIDRALASLPGDALERPSRAGLRVERFRDPTDVDALLELALSVFRAEREACWFATNPGYADTKRAALLQQCEAGDRWLLYRGETLMGTVSAEVEQRAAWGRVAGMDLVLLPEVRGLGLATWAYAHTLREAQAKGAARFRGGTSRPAVLALAARMGRVVQSAIVRRTYGFPLAHFGALLERSA